MYSHMLLEFSFMASSPSGWPHGLFLLDSCHFLAALCSVLETSPLQRGEICFSRVSILGSSSNPSAELPQLSQNLCSGRGLPDCNVLEVHQMPHSLVETVCAPWRVICQATFCIDELRII